MPCRRKRVLPPDEHRRRAIDDLGENPFVGTAIPKRLWPREYVRKHGVDNLRKYDLPEGWRLIYTLAGNEIEIV